MKTLWLAGLIFLMGTSSVALAEGEGASDTERLPRPDAKPAGEWYGWQTGLADAATAALFIGARLQGADRLALVGFTALMVATPGVHLANHQLGAGALSLALRTGGAVVGSMLGFIAGVAVANCAPDRDSHLPIPSACQNSLVFPGAIIGVAIPALIDMATARRPLADVRPARSPSAGWTPLISPTVAGVSVGVVGRF